MDLHFGYYFFVLVIYFGEGFTSFTVHSREFSTAAFLGLFDEMLNRMRPISHARSLAFRSDESSS